MDSFSVDPPRSLAPVCYAITCPQGPVLRLDVRRFELREALSELYRLEVEAVADAAGEELAGLLGASCTFSMRRGASDEGGGRAVHGVVTRVERLGAAAERQRVRLRVEPALALFGQQVSTRFWQGRRAPEIVREVLRGPLEALGRRIELDLEEDEYPPREYCVQYRESDLDFARRLLQEEGIAFSFDHGGASETLVLRDTTTRAPDLDVAALPFVPRGAGAAREQSVDRFEPASALGSTSVALRAWDWRDREGRPTTGERRGKDARGREREVYLHEEGEAGDDGERRARRELERRTWPCEQVHGSSDVVALEPGRCFALARHPGPEGEGRHLVVEVVHRGEAPETLVYAEEDDRARYVNEFRCIRPEVPFRPEQSVRRPRVYGPHTAIVTGPPGEEIHTDEHGRIKVRFHWDRVSPADDSASCWIRVAQAWAGPGWGGLFLPRVGMEVIVEFLDGDPDRPLVTGSVYNAWSVPPVRLPDAKTQSGIRSESSPGGGGYNEIRLEDAKGREELRVHAQRDLRVTVGNDHTQRVHGDQRLTIRKDRAVEVSEGDESLTIAQGKRTATIHGDDAVAVKTGNSALVVEQGSYALTTEKEWTAWSRTSEIRLVAETSLSLTASRQTLYAQGLRGVTIAADEGAAYVRAKKLVSVSSLDEGLLLCGKQAVSLRSVAETLTLGAGTDVTLSAAATAWIRAQEAVDVSGETVTIWSPQEITLRVGGSSITLGPEGITIQATKITSAAIGNQEITGALVKIN